MSESVAERTTLPSVYQWQADRIEEGATLLAYWVSTTPIDKLSWQPVAEGESSKTRSVYSQVYECAQVNRRFNALLKGEELGAWQKAPENPYATSEAAQEDLTRSATELAETVRALEPEAFYREYKSTMGSMTCQELLSIALNNMHYHGGQINYIQLLLGDTEFRYPGE